MDELIDQFPKETGLILARIFLKDQIPIEVTMKNFVFKLEKNVVEEMERLLNFLVIA